MRVLTFHSSGWVHLNFCPLTKVLKVFKTLVTFSNQNVFNEKSLSNGILLIFVKDFERKALQFEEYVVSEKRKRILATIEDETLMTVKHVSSKAAKIC